jgi:hypothetical protein
MLRYCVTVLSQFINLWPIYGYPVLSWQFINLWLSSFICFMILMEGDPKREIPVSRSNISEVKKLLGV